MKKLFLFLALSAYVHLSAQAQTTATTNPTATATSATLSDVKGQLDGVKGQLANIEKLIKDNSTDMKVEVGTLSATRFSDVPLYANVNDKKAIDSEKVNITRIKLVIRDGCIVGIYVFTQEGVEFKNYLAPIAVTEGRIAKGDGIGGIFKGNNRYIKINEVLTYEDTKGISSLPQDTEVELTPKAGLATLYKQVGINSIFDVRLYTDALGLFGAKGNGLVQTDVYFKHIYHRSNITNSGIFLFNYFKVNFSAAKFDSKLSYADSAKFTRTSLYEKSYMNVELANTLLNGWIGKRAVDNWYVDLGGGISLSRLAGLKDTTGIISTYWYIQPGIDFNFTKSFGFSGSARLLWHYSPQTSFNNNDGERKFIKLSTGFFWNPVSNEAARVFGRVCYVAESKDAKNHFFQLQFGAVLKLSSVIK